MSFAKSIRDFIDALFPRGIVLTLQAQIRQMDAEHVSKTQWIRERYEELLAQQKEAHAMDLQILAGAKLTEWNATNRHIDELETEITETRKERDYFRGRAERLELRLLPDPTPRRERATQAVPVGRRSWAQVQADNAEKIRLEREEAAKKKEGNIAAPPAETSEASEKTQ